jgi:hypothetical protein
MRRCSVGRREGKDDAGDRWEATSNALATSVWLKLDGACHRYTPTQARALAEALNELADEVDPRGSEFSKRSARVHSAIRKANEEMGR